MKASALQAKGRPAAIAGGSVVGLLVVTQLILPGSSGQTGRGTPVGVLFGATVNGLLDALVAVGIVLIFRSGRFINFAQVALGAAGGVFFYNLAVLNRWPFWLCLLGGLIVSGLLGLLIEIGIIRRFFMAPRLVLTVLTLALIGVLQGASQFVGTLPIFPRVDERSQEQLTGSSPIPVPFEDFAFRVAGLARDFGFVHVLSIVASLAAMLGLAAFLKYSRPGVSIRAAADNISRAPLLGINVGVLSMIVWGIAGVLSGLGVILNGLIGEQFTPGAAPPALLLTALAAAVIADMRSLPIAVGAATGITVLRQSVIWSFEQQVALVDLGLLLVIVIGLVVRRRHIERSEALETSSWEATKEHRATPREMLQVRGVRVARIVMAIIGLAFVLLYPLWATPRQTNLGGYIAIVSIVMLSLVVLTGWAGQVSLGQFGFVAIGAVLGGAMTARLGFSFWLSLMIVPILVAAIAFLIGIPALRIKGLFLAVTTYAFAFAVRGILFNESYFGWLLPERVDRPSLLLIDFADERSMYYLTVTALVLAVLVVVMLRRSRVGRLLIAVRDNEPNVQAFGINAVRMRLAAFAVSGGLCGFAGVLLAHHQQSVAGSSFEAQLSLDIFLIAVVGGVGSVAGAMLGTAYFALRELVTGNPIAAFIVGDVGLLAILYFSPGGLSSLFFGLRDAILRIIAQRKRIVVPSLFADVDPAAMMEGVIPLGEPLSAMGLNALSHDQRWDEESVLYGEAQLLAGRPAGGRSEEAAALVAAGGSEDDEPVRPIGGVAL